MDYTNVPIGATAAGTVSPSSTSAPAAFTGDANRAGLAFGAIVAIAFACFL